MKRIEQSVLEVFMTFWGSCRSYGVVKRVVNNGVPTDVVVKRMDLDLSKNVDNFDSIPWGNVSDVRQRLYPQQTRVLCQTDFLSFSTSLIAGQN